ncbi:hypothetical protein VNO80_16010 [Phaseolus coccineus]|uniref:Uncharacterized protein n=1 Tax=Phaseolus coccineus TaxID=3886 RepID=A0AAN9QZQ4_PHACN
MRTSPGQAYASLEPPRLPHTSKSKNSPKQICTPLLAKNTQPNPAGLSKIALHQDRASPRIDAPHTHSHNSPRPNGLNAAMLAQSSYMVWHLHVDPHYRKHTPQNVPLHAPNLPPALHHLEIQDRDPISKLPSPNNPYGDMEKHCSYHQNQGHAIEEYFKEKYLIEEMAKEVDKDEVGYQSEERVESLSPK